MPKLRITLYDNDERLISDRLVDQRLEFTTGPKEKHSGRIRLELNLEHADDTIEAIEYLRKLTGDLPLSPRQEKKILPKKTPTIMGIEPLKDLLHSAVTKNKNMEDTITYLRNLGFVFVSYQGLMDIVETNNFPFELKKEKHQDYQYMVRMTKRAKDPKNDKYDGQLFFGIKIYGTRYPKIITYMFGKYHKAFPMEWANAKEYNFKKVDKVYKFPDPMSYEERLRWRKELRQVESNPNYEPSKFYTKWQPYIKLMK